MAWTIEALQISPCPTRCRWAWTHPYGILVTGVGGTGIVTIGALLGTRRHAPKASSPATLDMAGLAQKGGPVWSHIRIAPGQQDKLFASRIAAGEADLVLGCDIVTAVSDESLAKMREGHHHAPIINRDFSVTSGFRARLCQAQARSGDVSHVHDPAIPGRHEMESQIADAVGAGSDGCAVMAPACRHRPDGRFSIATNLLDARLSPGRRA